MRPETTIKLRAFTVEDAPVVAQLVGDRAVSRWTSNIPFPYSERDAIDWITHTMSEGNRNPSAVELGGRLVGCVSYWPHEPDGVEVGYWVGRAFWGQGICTEALTRLLASDLFPAQSDVFAKVMVQNIGSQRVLEKCGFSLYENGTILKQGRAVEAKFYVRRAGT